MNDRESKGKELFENGNVHIISDMEHATIFKVVSETLELQYTVFHRKKDNEYWYCSCPDHTERGTETCKHIYACMFEIKRNDNPYLNDTVMIDVYNALYDYYSRKYDRQISIGSMFEDKEHENTYLFTFRILKKDGE